MTIFAGVFDLFKTDIDFSEIKKAIMGSVSNENRYDDIYQTDNFLLIKFDYGLFESKGYCCDDVKGVCTISGEPYLDGAVDSSRNANLLDIHTQLFNQNIDVLNNCSGTYSLCYYNHHNHSLLLATDKLGVRPLYYIIIDGCLYFSNSIKIFESIESIPKDLNLRSCIEKTSLGYILGDKSIYKDIKILRDGQYLSGTDKEFSLNQYFRWDQIKIKNKDKESILNEVHDEFLYAVKKRAEGKRDVLTFLSGGLDSRCIVSILNLLNKDITAINSYKLEDKDKVFAEMYADKIGITNYISKKRAYNTKSTEELLSSIISHANNQNIKVKQLKSIFSGDGGSVGLGHVYIDKDLNHDMASDKKKVIDSFLEKRQFPFGILRSNISKKLKNTLYESILSEINELDDLDPSKRLYIFLMRNDQRCHLHGYFENIDVYQKELLLPFFDSNFLEIIAGAPIDDFLYHNFYHQWLNLFPDSAQAVPWQTYPGHVPCDIKHDVTITDQWKISSLNFNLLEIIEIFRNINSKTVGNLIPWYKMYGALFLHVTGLRDYHYLFKIYQVFDQLCLKSENPPKGDGIS